MGKRTRNEKKPRLMIPLLIPTEEGAGALALGNGEVRGSTLIINFNDLIPAQAIRQRIERGDIVGITFVIPEDEAEAAKETEDAIQAAQDAAREEAKVPETEEERIIREAEEEARAAEDQILLDAELKRLED